ncbi:MAG: creatininase family protein [Pirellulales bacterium]
MIWQELKSPDFAAIDRRTPVLLPVAAVEQHGPHLPLATDRMIVDLFACELNARFGNSLLLLPTVAVGCSEHHMEFAGSLSLSHETFLAVCNEYLHSAWRHGFRNFLVLNAHGGNQGICHVLLEQFGAGHRDCRVAVATWWRVAYEALVALNESGPGGVGHACEFETSLMLLIAPQLVAMDAIEPKGNVPTFPWAEGDLLRSPQAGLFRTMREMTPHGAYGDPSLASAEKGQQIASVVCDALTKILSDLARS